MKDINHILLIDTALNGVNICLHDRRAQSYKESYLETVRGQAEQIVPMVQDVLKQANIEFADLDAIITTLGPGSFTGLRIGISTANSLALSLDIPIYGVSSFDAVKWALMADQSKLDAGFAVILETKRSDYYIQLFDETGLAISDPLATSHEQCQLLLDKHNILHIVGDACERFTAESAKNQTESKPTQSKLTQAKLSHTAIQFEDHSDSFIKSGKPIYLRGADISQPKKVPRQVAAD